MKKTFLISLTILLSAIGFAQKGQKEEALGVWITIDDETKKPKSLVEIYMKPNGKLYGKVIKLFRKPEEDQDPVCDKCTDDRKNKKIIGMEVIRDMVWNEKEKVWEDGTICDPKNGKIYDCKLWVENGKLQVRGYIAFLYRTQTWIKYVPKEKRGD